MNTRGSKARALEETRTVRRCLATGRPPDASVGQLHITSPWTIEDEDLSPIAYKCSTGL